MARAGVLPLPSNGALLLGMLMFLLAHGLLSCVSAVFGVCSSGLLGGRGGGGAGGRGEVPNVTHSGHS